MTVDTHELGILLAERWNDYGPGHDPRVNGAYALLAAPVQGEGTTTAARQRSEALTALARATTCIFGDTSAVTDREAAKFYTTIALAYIERWDAAERGEKMPKPPSHSLNGWCRKRGVVLGS